MDIHSRCNLIVLYQRCNDSHNLIKSNFGQLSYKMGMGTQNENGDTNKADREIYHIRPAALESFVY